MRKLSKTELKLLKLMDTKDRIDYSPTLWPFQQPPRVPCTTYRNLYKLGLIRVSRSGLVEMYPLEITDLGRKYMEVHHAKEAQQ